MFCMWAITKRNLYHQRNDRFKQASAVSHHIRLGRALSLLFSQEMVCENTIQFNNFYRNVGKFFFQFALGEVNWLHLTILTLASFQQEISKHSALRGLNQRWLRVFRIKE